MALASFSTIAPIVSILTDTIEDVSMREPLKNYQRYTARLTILGMGTVIARLTWNYLGYFESIMGGVCSISISLLLPILFYAKLYRWRHTRTTKVLFAVATAISGLLILLLFGMDLYQLRIDVKAS